MPEITRVGRVLMTADTVGGVWAYAMQLATLLAGRGTEVILATLGREPTAMQTREARSVPNLKLHTTTFALEWMPEPWQDVERSGRWLLDLEARVTPDVIHLNGFAHGALPFRAPTLVVAHSCVSSWWRAVRNDAPPAEWSRYVDAVRSGLASATRIAAPTRAMRDALVRCYGVGHDAVIIPHARSIARWRSQIKEPFVFAAGQAWDVAKNYSALDRAAKTLPWPVKLADDVSTESDRGLRFDHLEPLGAQDPNAVADLMRRAAIFAHPALYEPFGLSVLEAALSRCALVLADIDTLRENWTGAARFVAPSDAMALRDAIAELIANPTEREALAAAARRRAELFSPEQHRDRYYDVYSQLLQQRGSVGITRSAAAPSSIGFRA